MFSDGGAFWGVEGRELELTSADMLLNISQRSDQALGLESMFKYARRYAKTYYIDSTRFDDVCILRAWFRVSLGL